MNLTAKESLALVETAIANYVTASEKASDSLKGAIIKSIAHTLAFDECSTVNIIINKVKVYGNSKELAAVKALVRQTVPFDLETGKKVQDKVAKALENWDKIRPVLDSSSEPVSLLAWYEGQKGAPTGQTTDEAKAKAKAAKEAKIVADWKAKEALSNPVFARILELQSKAEELYKANPSQAIDMLDAELKRFQSSLVNILTKAVA